MLSHALLHEVVQNLLVVITDLVQHFGILRDVVIVIIHRSVVQAAVNRHIALHLGAAGAVQATSLTPADIVAIVASPGVAIGLAQIRILEAIAHGIELGTCLLMLSHALLHEVVQNLLVVITDLVQHFGILRDVVIVIIHRRVVQTITGINRRIALHLSAAGAVQAGGFTPADIVVIVTSPGVAIGLAQIRILEAIAHGIELGARLLMLSHALLHEVAQDSRIVITILVKDGRILGNVVVVIVNGSVVQAAVNRHIALHLGAAGAVQAGGLAPADIMAIVAGPGIAIGLAQIRILKTIAHGIELSAALLMLGHALLHEVSQNLCIVSADLLYHIGILLDVVVVVVNRSVIQAIARVDGQMLRLLAAAGADAIHIIVAQSGDRHVLLILHIHAIHIENSGIPDGAILGAGGLLDVLSDSVDSLGLAVVAAAADNRCRGSGVICGPLDFTDAILMAQSLDLNGLAVSQGHAVNSDGCGVGRGAARGAGSILGLDCDRSILGLVQVAARAGDLRSRGLVILCPGKHGRAFVTQSLVGDQFLSLSSQDSFAILSHSGGSVSNLTVLGAGDGSGLLGQIDLGPLLLIAALGALQISSLAGIAGDITVIVLNLDPVEGALILMRASLSLHRVDGGDGVGLIAVLDLTLADIVGRDAIGVGALSGGLFGIGGQSGGRAQRHSDGGVIDEAIQAGLFLLADVAGQLGEGSGVGAVLVGGPGGVGSGIGMAGRSDGGIPISLIRFIILILDYAILFLLRSTHGLAASGADIAGTGVPAAAAVLGEVGLVDLDVMVMIAAGGILVIDGIAGGQRAHADGADQVGDPHELIVVVDLLGTTHVAQHLVQVVIVGGVVVGLLELITIAVGLVINRVVGFRGAVGDLVLTGDITQVGGNGDGQLIAAQQDAGNGMIVKDIAIVNLAIHQLEGSAAESNGVVALAIGGLILLDHGDGAVGQVIAQDAGGQVEVHLILIISAGNGNVGIGLALLLMQGEQVGQELALDHLPLVGVLIEGTDAGVGSGLIPAGILVVEVDQRGEIGIAGVLAGGLIGGGQGVHRQRIDGVGRAERGGTAAGIGLLGDGVRGIVHIISGVVIIAHVALGTGKPGVLILLVGGRLFIQGLQLAVIAVEQVCCAGVAEEEVHMVDITIILHAVAVHDLGVHVIVAGVQIVPGTIHLHGIPVVVGSKVRLLLTEHDDVIGEGDTHQIDQIALINVDAGAILIIIEFLGGFPVGRHAHVGSLAGAVDLGVHILNQIGQRLGIAQADGLALRQSAELVALPVVQDAVGQAVGSLGGVDLNGLRNADLGISQFNSGLIALHLRLGDLVDRLRVSHLGRAVVGHGDTAIRAKADLLLVAVQLLLSQLLDGHRDALSNLNAIGLSALDKGVSFGDQLLSGIREVLLHKAVGILFDSRFIGLNIGLGLFLSLTGLNEDLRDCLLVILGTQAGHNAIIDLVMELLSDLVLDLALEVGLDLRLIGIVQLLMHVVIVRRLLLVLSHHGALVRILTAVHDVGHIEAVHTGQPVIQSQQALGLVLSAGSLDRSHGVLRLSQHLITIILHAQLIAVHEVHDGAGQVVIGVLAGSDLVNGGTGQSQHLAENAEVILIVVVGQEEGQLDAQHVGVFRPLLQILLEHAQHGLLLLLRQSDLIAVLVLNGDLAQLVRNGSHHGVVHVGLRRSVSDLIGHSHIGVGLNAGSVHVHRAQRSAGDGERGGERRIGGVVRLSDRGSLLGSAGLRDSVLLLAICHCGGVRTGSGFTSRILVFRRSISRNHHQAERHRQCEDQTQEPFPSLIHFLSSVSLEWKNYQKALCEPLEQRG